MEIKLIGAPIALYKEFETGAEKGVAAIRKVLGNRFQSLNLANSTQESANDKNYAKAKKLLNKYILLLTKLASGARARDVRSNAP